MGDIVQSFEGMIHYRVLTGEDKIQNRYFDVSTLVEILATILKGLQYLQTAHSISTEVDTAQYRYFVVSTAVEILPTILRVLQYPHDLYMMNISNLNQLKIASTRPALHQQSACPALQTGRRNRLGGRRRQL